MLKIRRFLNRDILNISEIEEYLDRKLIKPDARAEKWSNDIKKLGMNDAKTSELLKFCALNIFTKIDNFTNHLADFVYSFTLDEIDDERLENDGISWIFKNFPQKIQSIDFKDRISCKISLTNGKVFEFSRLNKHYNFEGIIDDLTTKARDSKCHPRSLFIACCAPEQEHAKCVTGKVWKHSPKAKYLHSWVEIDGQDGKEYCIDNNYNVVMDKELFYYIFHPTVIQVIDQNTIRKDWSAIQFLSEKTRKGLNFLKFYCVSRDSAIDVYEQMKSGKNKAALKKIFQEIEQE